MNTRPQARKLVNECDYWGSIIETSQDKLRKKWR